MAGRTSTWHVGDPVQTPFGKGVVREVRSNGHVLVQVRARTLVLPPDALSLIGADRRRQGAGGSPTTTGPTGAEKAEAARTEAAIDLHGLTVEEALANVELALNDALLADVPQLRFIHGRSGGRIRAALHRYLRGIPSVRHFSLDSQNAGVTVVDL